MITRFEIIKFNKRLRGWYKKHEGTAIYFTGAGKGNNGQCVVATDSALKEVYGLPYVFTPAAKDFWNKFNSIAVLKKNFTKVPYEAKSYPKKGWLVVYGEGVGSVYGHVDICGKDGDRNGYMAYDSNWDAVNYHDKNGYPTLHQVQHPYANYILGYLRPNNDIKFRPKV